MIVQQNINGYYVISTILNGYLFKRVYGGYTLKESIKRFERESKKENKKSKTN